MATITCITTLLLVGTSKLDLHTNWFLLRVQRCLDQPIPNKFADFPSHTPCLELTGKPHDAAKRQDVLGKAGEVLFFGNWHHIEIDVLDVIRLINQIDPNHLSSPKAIWAGQLFTILDLGVDCCPSDGIEML